MNEFAKYNIGSVTLKLPFSHQLPNYQKDYLYYDRFLPFLAKHMNNDSVILEVGANVGDTVAGLIQSCANKIIAIEGHPIFYDFLRENVASFPCSDRIVTHRALVGSGKYLGTLVENGSTASLRLDGKTMVSRLDEIASELKVDFQKVALIIIDTDGYDGDVLNSASRIIHESIPVVYWENSFENADQYTALQEAYRLLTDSNYEYFTIFDNFGVPLMVNTNLDALMNFNRYVAMTRRSSASRPSIFYTDVCATTEQNKQQVSNAIRDCYGTLDIQTM
ncbi:MAG: FkbM family methyltransferase [Methylovirgula sp.]